MNKLYTLFIQSTKAILSNKVRSFLTMLGIIIGVGSVIALMALGSGASESISDRISDLGTNTITINSGAPRVREPNHVMPGMSGGGQATRGMRNSFSSQTEPTLITRDLISIKKIAEVNQAVGTVNDRVVIEKNSQEPSLDFIGTQPAYFDINNLSINSGRLITDEDLANNKKYLVIGPEIVADLGFSTTKQALNKQVTIEDKTFTIIGVLNETEASMRSNPNSQVFTPITTAREVLDQSGYKTIQIQVLNEEVIDQVVSDIDSTLLSNHNIKDQEQADFSIFSPNDILNFAEQATSTFTMLLVGIAAISLLVGGIGIMNIMIVSVTERTREIGLRKAVGATRSDIVIQFLIESVILTLLGGAIGILLGIGLGKIAEPYLGFSAVVTSESILLSAGVSILVGLIFGLYPAIKASKLRPIDALRYE